MTLSIRKNASNLKECFWWCHGFSYKFQIKSKIARLT